MQDRWSYIKGSDEFLKEIKNIGKIPEGTLFVTADVFGLYPVYLMQLAQKHFEKDSLKGINLRYLLRKFEFVLKNNFLNSTAWSNCNNLEKLLAQNLHLLMLASSWMKQRHFLKSQESRPFLWLCYIDIFLYELMDKRNTLSFLINLIVFVAF